MIEGSYLTLGKVQEFFNVYTTFPLYIQIRLCPATNCGGTHSGAYNGSVWDGHILYYKTVFHIFDGKFLNISRIIIKTTETDNPLQSDICKVQYLAIIVPPPAKCTNQSQPLKSTFARTRMVLDRYRQPPWPKQGSRGFYSIFLTRTSEMALNHPARVMSTTINCPNTTHDENV